MSTRITIAAGAALALMIGLGGCSTGAVLDAEAPVATAPAAESPAPTASDAPAPAEGEAEAASGQGVYLDYVDGAIADTPGLKVLFFHASWCPKCRALDADIRANEIPAGMTIYKVDFDTATELRQRYGVTLQTTIVYVDDEGEILTKGVLYDDTTLDALIAAAP